MALLDLLYFCLSAIGAACGDWSKITGLVCCMQGCRAGILMCWMLCRDMQSHRPKLQGAYIVGWQAPCSVWIGFSHAVQFKLEPHLLKSCHLRRLTVHMKRYSLAIFLCQTGSSTAQCTYKKSKLDITYPTLIGKRGDSRVHQWSLKRSECAQGARVRLADVCCVPSAPFCVPTSSFITGLLNLQSFYLFFFRHRNQGSRIMADPCSFVKGV